MPRKECRDEDEERKKKIGNKMEKQNRISGGGLR